METRAAFDFDKSIRAMIQNVPNGNFTDYYNLASYGLTKQQKIDILTKSCGPNSFSISGWAIYHGQLDFFKDFLLLATSVGDKTKQVFLNWMPSSGYTYLHIAALQGHTEIVKYLLNDLHMKPEQKSFFGSETPADIAKSRGHDEIVLLLKISNTNKQGEQEEVNGLENQTAVPNATPLAEEITQSTLVAAPLEKHMAVAFNSLSEAIVFLEKNSALLPDIPLDQFALLIAKHSYRNEAKEVDKLAILIKRELVRRKQQETSELPALIAQENKKYAFLAGEQTGPSSQQKSNSIDRIWQLQVFLEQHLYDTAKDYFLQTYITEGFNRLYTSSAWNTDAASIFLQQLKEILIQYGKKDVLSAIDLSLQERKLFLQKTSSDKMASSLIKNFAIENATIEEILNFFSNPESAAACIADEVDIQMNFVYFERKKDQLGFAGSVKNALGIYMYAALNTKEITPKNKETIKRSKQFLQRVYGTPDVMHSPGLPGTQEIELCKARAFIKIYEILYEMEIDYAGKNFLQTISLHVEQINIHPGYRAAKPHCVTLLEAYVHNMLEAVKKHAKNNPGDRTDRAWQLTQFYWNADLTNEDVKLTLVKKMRNYWWERENNKGVNGAANSAAAKVNSLASLFNGVASVLPNSIFSVSRKPTFNKATMAELKKLEKPTAEEGRLVRTYEQLSAIPHMGKN